MRELPTNKTNFLSENTQDFNQMTHGRPQDPIVFIHNISLDFNCLGPVKDVFKWSHHGCIMLFSEVHTEQLKVLSEIFYVWFGRQFILLFRHSKMVLANTERSDL